MPCDRATVDRTARLVLSSYGTCSLLHVCSPEEQGSERVSGIMTSLVLRPFWYGLAVLAVPVPPPLMLAIYYGNRLTDATETTKRGSLRAISTLKTLAALYGRATIETSEQMQLGQPRQEV